MASVRRNNEDGPLSEIEMERNANIARNKEMLATLIPPRPEVQYGQAKKRTKRTHHTSAVATGQHNLHPRPERNYAESAQERIDKDLDCQSIGDFLCDNEGKNSRQLSSVIGCLVRKKLSVRYLDWRLIDVEEKEAVWDEVQKFYDIIDAGKNWFLKSAAQKWKDFKSTLKEEYFDENLTDEELNKRHGGRVNDEDWKFLVNYWKSPECEVRTQIAKLNRAKLEIHHTSGTKSFACSAYEMVDELGRPPRRDEIFIKSHTRKNGVAIRNAEPIISKLEETIEACPELTERTIQQGDVFVAALGSKEPRGRVRALGLGPTPQDVGIAGLKSYTPTRFQMEVLACKKAENRNETLEQRLTQMEAHIQMMEERFALERRNAEVMSQNGSNSQQNASPRSAEHVHEAYNENNDVIDAGEYLLVDRPTTAPTMQSPSNAALVMQPPVAPSCQLSPTNSFSAVQPNVASQVQSRQCCLTNAAPTTQPHASQPSQLQTTKPAQPQVAKPAKTKVAKSAQAMNVNAPRSHSHEEHIGRDVILYEVVRSDAVVAKGTILSVNPKNTLGGVALGKHYCEVVVNVVMKRDAILPRPYPGVEKMGDALKLPIAWPYNRMKVSMASTSTHGTSGGRP